MAAIAVSRSAGCLLGRYNCEHLATRIFKPWTAAVGCAAIWVLSFAILSPITFSLTIGDYSFGSFAYDEVNRKCSSTTRAPEQFSVKILYYVPACSLFLTLLSYIVISGFLEIEQRTRLRILGSQSQVKVEQIQVTLLILSASYLIFLLPVMIVENTTLRDSALATLGVHSMYYWMFAVNFVIYMLTLSDFRRLYRDLLLDFWSSGIIPLFNEQEIYRVTE